ncbi:uncharacterized protein FFB14_02981 [Fusarium fujikuroi]|nr:uncharacterized protein FFB14_02981 [Fusarium fujikuroi]
MPTTMMLTQNLTLVSSPTLGLTRAPWKSQEDPSDAADWSDNAEDNDGDERTYKPTALEKKAKKLGAAHKPALFAFNSTLTIFDERHILPRGPE